MSTQNSSLEDESRQAFAQWDDDERDSRSAGGVRIFQSQPNYNAGRGNLINRSAQRRPGRGSQNRPLTEENLREREDPHYGKPHLERPYSYNEETEQLIYSILNDDITRTNISRDSLAHLPGRENFIVVWTVAIYRGKPYYRGTRNELAWKLIFESVDHLIALIQDDSLMESTVTKLNLNRRKPMPNELTRLIEFEGILGDDVIRSIDSAAPDERRSALLMGLRRILKRLYDQTPETYAVYKTAESQSYSQLNSYFQESQKFARSLIWPHNPSPRWNPPLLAMKDFYHMPKTPQRDDGTPVSILKRSHLESDGTTQHSNEFGKAPQTEATTPPNAYEKKEKSTPFVDPEQAILQPNLILKIDTGKLLTMNEDTNKKFCGEKLRQYINQVYPPRSTRLLEAIDDAPVAELQQMIFSKGHLEQLAKQLGIFPRTAINQSPTKKIQAPRNSTEVYYLLSIERKHCTHRNIFPTFIAVVNAIQPIVEGFGHPFTVHPVQYASNEPTLYDVEEMESRKADLEGIYITNITTEGWSNVLKFRIRVATTLDLIHLLNRTAQYNVSPNLTLEKQLSKLSTVISVISQNRCERNGIIGISASTQLDNRDRARHEIVKLLQSKAQFNIAPDKFEL